MLPLEAFERARGRAWGVYLHVPFCRSRCGYCDFNTYTPAELRGSGPASPGTTLVDFGDWAAREIEIVADLGRQAMPGQRPAIDTVFIGGGTPTMLPAAELTRLLTRIDALLGLVPGAEITTEANPDTVDTAYLEELAAGGFTRVSLGMQSSVAHVLATLERSHDPANVERAVEAARAAGLAVSLDLIYGTPGETLTDWQASLDSAIALGPDHLSAYALVLEEGSRMGALVRRGQLLAPDDDDEADKYELADAVLEAAGYHWYEVSNWARTPQQVCQHNLGYWRGGNWWGIGPGAHSHIGGVRWWNVRHPARYAALLAEGRLPVDSHETLSEDQRYDEEVLLGSRLSEGLELRLLRAAGHRAVPGLVADGLATVTAGSRMVLTRRGRLLADIVVRRLLGW